MSFLSIQHISKRFGSTVALHDFSLEITGGETIALLGASGCGKTTLLRCLAGFEIPDSGSISLEDETLTGPGQFVRPHERHVGLLFQDYALFPHLTALQNIRLGHQTGAEGQTPDQLLELVRLSGLAERYPHQLSGGQQQRVALARALATGPRVLLLDEPFSNLDRLLRSEIRAETAALVRQLGLTTIVVTHDADDAVALADRIALMDHGRLVALGTPRSLYDQPSTLLTAVLFGEINVLEKTDATCRALRPEHVVLQPVPTPRSIPAAVRTSLPVGGRYRLSLQTPHGEWTAYADQDLAPGTVLHAECPDHHILTLLP